MTGQQRLTAQMIERGVTSYGRTLTLPPQALPPDLEIVEDARRANTWYAAMSLWTKEEGESDLNLELTLTENRLGLVDIEIDGLHSM